MMDKVLGPRLRVQRSCVDFCGCLVAGIGHYAANEDDMRALNTCFEKVAEKNVFSNKHLAQDGFLSCSFKGTNPRVFGDQPSALNACEARNCYSSAQTS